MSFRRAILGNSKEAVISALGAPRTAQMTKRQYQSRAGDCLQADTWYYPVPPRSQTAMAITFANGRARDVQFIHVPM